MAAYVTIRIYSIEHKREQTNLEQSFAVLCTPWADDLETGD
jgi:hypothetical protein